MFNPYEHVDWSNSEKLHSFNHFHLNPIRNHAQAKRIFQTGYDAGIRHFPFGDYVPSHHNYPLEDFFEEGFIPSDVLSAPNSEKVATLEHGKGTHFSALGSLYNSGGHHSEEPYLPWRDKFDLILDNLLFEDGGGIVINHPRRNNSNNRQNMIKLDYDERVLGIEAYSHRGERDYGNRGIAFDVWDEILLTGRKCFGFASPDENGGIWDIPNNYGLGRNVLLVDELSEHKALKAYRDGNFYGQYSNTNLAFNEIRLDDWEIFVSSNADKIKFIIGEFNPSITSFQARTREIEMFTGDASVKLDKNTIYVRVFAESESDWIFSQPIFYKNKNDIDKYIVSKKNRVIALI